jgi:tetratricopeptide (TPR) repeat protein
MSNLTFTFALIQQQNFELQCKYGDRRLDKKALAELIDRCEQNYYADKKRHNPTDLIELGKQLYRWLDGQEGWLRQALNESDQQTIYLDLIQTSDATKLNPETEKIALKLSHLPWELLHDGELFLLHRQDIEVLPIRKVHQRPGDDLGQFNRPLRLLFMATSPHGIEPILSFEQEEANILEATRNQPLSLVVEESGSVNELMNLVQYYPEHHFDVFHLTGHGLIASKEKYGDLFDQDGNPIADNTPCFLTEDDTGNRCYTTVQDLARAFRRRWPRVVFLSGCHTGQIPDHESVPSMAQALVKAGANVVLGWARPVFDRTGIIAAQALYNSLAAGNSLETALNLAQQEMIKQRCSDWHLLRVYEDSRSIASLVTPLRTKGREKLQQVKAESEFLDIDQGRVKVAAGKDFVGRRRPLQRCLGAMKQTSDRIGVYIHGMGGLGKSTLAARLCDRVRRQRSNFRQVVLIGPMTKSNLITKLSQKYEQFKGVPELLNEPQVSFKGRLQNFFAAIEDPDIDQPLLLVLDDFEQNIAPQEIEAGSMRLSTDAYNALEALCAALAENQATSRLIVTCRYLAELPPHNLYVESLVAMSKADIDKKCRLLPEEIQTQAKDQRIQKIADGNPRLLEWLAEVLKEGILDSDELLGRLEQTQQDFRQDVLAETLLGALNEAEQKFLARVSVFNLPVSGEILQAVVDDTSYLERQINLSLIEQGLDPATQSMLYRVSTVMEPLLTEILTEAEWHSTYQQATQQLYQVWWEEADGATESQMLEIVRLALLAREQEIAASIGDRVATRWYNQSRYVEALELCQQILAVFEDYRILSTIARAEQVLGEVESALAHYQQALALCPEQDLDRKGSILNNTAGLLAQQGNIDQAIQFWYQVVDITDLVGNDQGKAATLNNMARVIAAQGDIDRAMQLWQESLALYDRIGDVQGKAATLGNMAGVIAAQGDIDRAMQLWQESLALYDRIGDVQGKAATLGNMAGVIADQGDIDRAMQLWQESLALYDRIGDVQGKAATLNNMALRIADQGDIDRAMQLWQESLALKERIGDVKGKAATLNNMARVIAAQGDIDRAMQLWQESLALYDRIGDVKGKAATLNNMARVIAAQGDIDRAMQLWQESLALYDRIGDVKGKAATLNNMARVIAAQGDIDRAMQLWQQVVEITDHIGNVRGKAATLANMAYIAGEQGDKARELELNIQAAQALGQVKAYVDLLTVLGNLGVAAETNGLNYLAQAAWLSLRIRVPLPSAIQLLFALFNRVPQGDDLEVLSAAMAMFLCATQGEGHPQIEQLQDAALRMLSAAASARGIESEAALMEWFNQQQLNQPNVFMPQLDQRLVESIGDTWLFDPRPLLGGQSG